LNPHIPLTLYFSTPKLAQIITFALALNVQMWLKSVDKRLSFTPSLIHLTGYNLVTMSPTHTKFGLLYIKGHAPGKVLPSDAKDSGGRQFKVLFNGCNSVAHTGTTFGIQTNEMLKTQQIVLTSLHLHWWPWRFDRKPCQFIFLTRSTTDKSLVKTDQRILEKSQK